MVKALSQNNTYINGHAAYDLYRLYFGRSQRTNQTKCLLRLIYRYVAVQFTDGRGQCLYSQVQITLSYPLPLARTGPISLSMHVTDVSVQKVLAKHGYQLSCCCYPAFCKPTVSSAVGIVHRLCRSHQH